MKSIKQLRESKPSTEDSDINEVNNGLGSFVSQMKLLLKDPKAKKAHSAASSLIMRAQEKGAMAKTAVSAIKKALPGLAKKAGGSWEKKILGMKTMMIEAVELEEGYRVVGPAVSGGRFKSRIFPSKKEAEKRLLVLTKATDLRGKRVYKSLEVVKESVELEEAKEVSLAKSGKYDLLAVGKNSVGVQLMLRYNKKMVVTGSKKDGLFIMAFKKTDGNNKLPNGAEVIKTGQWIHIGFKKAEDVIDYAKFGDITEELESTNIEEGSNLEEVFSQAQMKKAIGIARKSTGNYDKAYAEIEKIKKGLADEHIVANALKKANESVEEAVSVDMRTKGYKEAIARGLLKASKNVKKSEIEEIIDAANKHIMGENEGMTAAGSDATGAVDGYDKPLGKTKKRKSFKESVDLDEGVSSEAKAVMKEIDKNLKILKTELKTSDENQDWKARLNRIEGIIRDLVH